MNTKKFQTEIPTRPWGVNRMRVDVAERLKIVAKMKGVTVVQLANDLLDKGLRRLEGIEKRKGGIE